MIPVRLTLRNFLSYADDCPPLLFDGFRLACLSGDNGNGKSAILDAITWALWGRARTSDDELVHQGRAEMEVDFEFRLGETGYRVVRKRLRPRKERGAGQTVVDLQIGGDAGFRSISGNGVRETDRRIVDLLRMSYDTFVNSAFLLQGRADEFTVKPPAERKRVLGEILGLSLYDDLEKRSRERARDREARLRELRAAIDQIDREIQARPQHEEELRQIERDLETLQARVAAAQAAFQAARDRQALARERQRQLADLRRDVVDAEREHADAGRDLEQWRLRVEAEDAVLSRRAETVGGFARLVAARERLATLSAVAERQTSLTERQLKLQRVVDDAKHRLAGQRQAHEATLAIHHKRLAKAADERTELTECRRQRAALNALQQQLDALRQGQETVITRTQELRADNARLKEEMEELADRIRRLAGEDATCPLCETELGVEGKARLRETLTTDGQTRKLRYRQNEGELRALAEARAAGDREIQQTERRLLEERKRLDGAIGSLENRLREAELAEDAAAKLEALMAEIDRRVAAGAFAVDEQAQLSTVLAELSSLSYDGDEHRRVLADRDRFAVFEEHHRQLANAEASVERDRASLAAAEQLLRRRVARLAELRERFDEIAREVEGMGDVDAAVVGADDELRGATDRLHDKLARRARVQQRLESCDQLDVDRRLHLVEQQAAAREKSVYEELAVAFGKKGIQAMIIETALPEIEREANAILSRMTDSRMHVRLESQRDSKKGDTIETLDIKIADELGTRSYESFSGGETFRVNFAVRIALSKLLARRAGARLQTLIIDEGFGTQDAGGREKLVEAITAIQHDFERILVITHIDELRDQFPVRIEVTKTANGSTFAVV